MLCPTTSGFLSLPILICFVTVVTVFSPFFVSVVVSDSVLIPLSSVLLSWLDFAGTPVLSAIPKPSGAALRSACGDDLCDSWTFDLGSWCFS
jgi:hypothetical protein